VRGIKENPRDKQAFLPSEDFTGENKFCFPLFHSHSNTPVIKKGGSLCLEPF